MRINKNTLKCSLSELMRQNENQFIFTSFLNSFSFLHGYVSSDMYHHSMTIKYLTPHYKFIPSNIYSIRLFSTPLLPLRFLTFD